MTISVRGLVRIPITISGNSIRAVSGVGFDLVLLTAFCTAASIGSRLVVIGRILIGVSLLGGVLHQYCGLFTFYDCGFFVLFLLTFKVACEMFLSDV